MSEAASTAGVSMTSPGAQGLIGHPDDVVRDLDASLADRGSVVNTVETLRALKAPDEAAGSGARKSPGWTPYPRKRGAFLSCLRTGRQQRPDDDDPPPRPASAAVPVKIVVVDALAA
jgi:hypothetical protein